MNYNILIILICFFIGSSQTDIVNEQKAEEKIIKILFVGNSLTYYNNLPQMVTDYAWQYNIEINSDIIAKPNYAIIDHLAEGEVHELIKTGNYDYVIIQQGPSSQEDGKRMLIEGGKNYSQLCKKYNSKLVY